ncbi:antitoxin [Candidatus Woesearchaeota archaeon]|nr:antitoxin [Candidatus Woesearchaeota archaeon]
MSKLISISDELYERLSELKGKESYSSVIRSLLEVKRNKEMILSFAGKDGLDMGAFRDLKKEWKKWSQNYV